ncbi:MAG: glycosyltransferase family 4 protein [Spirochaetia bacterium]|nr:glycosyltransferase family 4 protein [Spirochaetia bacterium]
MSLLYDARLIENSGIGTTIRGQLRELIARKFDVRVIGNPDTIRKVLPEYSGEIVPFTAPLYSIKEQFRFPSPGSHRLHIPHYNIPLRFASRLSVTVHDLIHLQSDEFKSPIYRTYARVLLGTIARRAPCIFTVSETTRGHFLEMFPEARPRTFTTLNGIEHNIFRPAKDSSVQAFRKRYGVPGDFLLAVGIAKRHKNLDLLLRVLTGLWRTDFPFPLVLAGTSGKIPDYARTLFQENAVRKNVILLPHIPESDLPTLYSAASALVIPSKLEGFGLPALEAMACGTPVLASTAGSLKEVCADSALYFDPESEADLSASLQKFAESKPLRKKLATRGLNRAQNFTWKRNVDGMLRGFDLTGKAPT